MSDELEIERDRICGELERMAQYAGPRWYVELEAAKQIVGGGSGGPIVEALDSEVLAALISKETGLALFTTRRAATSILAELRKAGA